MRMTVQSEPGIRLVISMVVLCGCTAGEPGLQQREEGQAAHPLLRAAVSDSSERSALPTVPGTYSGWKNSPCTNDLLPRTDGNDVHNAEEIPVQVDASEMPEVIPSIADLQRSCAAANAEVLERASGTSSLVRRLALLRERTARVDWNDPASRDRYFEFKERTLGEE